MDVVYKEKDNLEWSKTTWKKKHFIKKQQPQWPHKKTLNEVTQKIKDLPPLVFAGEINALKKLLCKVSSGESFLLQGGDCAESFQQCSSNNIRENLKIFLQMSLILGYTGGKNVIRVGRIAGQFAKPRSSDTEVIDNIELPSYRGDMVNRVGTTMEERKPNPQNLLQGYFYSAITLNLIRAFLSGGFASLDNIHKWNINFVKNTSSGKLYNKIAQEIDKSISFFKTLNIENKAISISHATEHYTSHEALLLEYEEALTRRDSLSGKWYNCSAHMLWIGDRTRDIDSAHIELLRGVENPIGIKVGKNHTPQEICNIINIINPKNEEGKIILIVRFGNDDIEKYLPLLIKVIKKEQLNVVWSCDPMHGNTYTAGKYKTRSFIAIEEEIKKFFRIAYQENIHPGGIHLEFTGSNVTECVGGVENIDEKKIGSKLRYSL